MRVNQAKKGGDVLFVLFYHVFSFCFSVVPLGRRQQMHTYTHFSVVGGAEKNASRAYTFSLLNVQPRHVMVVRTWEFGILKGQVVKEKEKKTVSKFVPRKKN